MPQQKLLIRVVEFLENQGVPYMLTGSLASSLQGEPRSTHDIDLVVSMTIAHVPAFLAAFPNPDYYLSEVAMRDALSQRTMFNLLSIADADKVDFWILTDGDFDRSRFARRGSETISGKPIRTSAPEDTILMKLRWSRDCGGSPKQVQDALRVFEVRHGQLDMNYIERWIVPLGIETEWRELKSNAVIAYPDP